MTDEEFAKSIGASISDDDFAKSIGAVPLGKPSFGEQTMVALKQGFNAPGDLINRAATGVAGTIANLMGKDDARDKMFQTMEQELKASQQWSNPNNIEPGVLPSIIGTIPNLPAQMATFPLAPFETGQEMLKRGESLSTALAGTGITTAMNAAGALIPGAIPAGTGVRMASGAAINAMQTMAQQLSLQGISKTAEGKQAYKLKPQDIAVAGVLGAGFGAAAKPRPKVIPKADPALGSKVDEFFAGKTNPSDGFKAGEYAGEVNLDLWNKNKQLDAERQQQAYTDALEAQRVREAEQYAAQQYPEQSTVGLSTGEGLPSVRDPSRPQAASNLMGTLEGPRIAPVGLSLGEDTPGGAIINRPAGPSNLMGEPVPPVAGPVGLSTGEGVPGGRNIQRTPETSSGLMGVDPKPFDPFGSAGASPKRIGKFGQGGGIQMDLLLPKKLVDMLYKWRDAGGRMLIPDITRMVEDSEVKLNDDVRSILIEKYKDNDITQRYLNRVQKAINANDFDRAQSRYKNLDNHLMTSLINEEEQGYNKFTPEQQEYRAKTGLYSKRDQARTEYERTINKFGQGGSAPIIGDLAEGIVRLGGLLKGKKTGQVVLPPDSLAEPRSPEMVKTKLEKTAKAKAIGLKNTVYDSPGSLEELKANPGKDIGFTIGDKQRSPGQALGSGAEAVVRRNPENNSTKYVRSLYSKARNASENLVHTFVTGPNAYTTTLRAMSGADKITAYELVQKLSTKKENYTPELGDYLGLSTPVKAYMEQRQKAFQGQFDYGASVNAKLGLKQFEQVDGYSPANFDSAYRTLVYEQVKNKDGTTSQKIVAAVNANSLWEMKKGVELYEQRSKERVAKGLSPYVFKKLDPAGLKSNTSPMARFDATARLLAEMANLDKSFAAAKEEVDSVIAGKTKELYKFNVHELHKKGVEGAIGNRPWLTLERNADDFFKMEIDHLDTGFRYWAYQDAITKTHQFVSDLEINQPNAKKWANDYTKRITGQELNPLGGLMNSMIDIVQTPLGWRGAKNAYMATGVARGVVNAWLMGFWNPTFMAIQSSQLIVNGLVEAARLRVDLDIPHTKVVTALGEAVAARTYLTYADMTGKLDKITMFADMKDDYLWAKEHGLHTYSEVALSHEAAMNPKLRAAKNIAMHPTTLPEFFTRPTAFMWYAQMMREAGHSGEQARVMARDATDITMTNYHPDELPMVYKDLGVMGKQAGSLKAFVHNNTDQFIARMAEANKYPLAAGTMIGMTLLLQGITGVIGYGLANELSMALTNQTLTEWMEQLLEPENRKHLHGLASALSNVDIQQRFSTADAIPGSFTEALAGPQFGKLTKVGVAVWDYGKNQDKASLLALGKELTPTGMVGIYEDKLLTDEAGFVLNKEGERKYETPRTQEQRDLRRRYGIRPLDERLKDEALYRDNQRMAKMDDKQKKAYDKMKTSLALDDTAGFTAARKKFLEEGGNPQSIERAIETAKVEAAKSERQRRQGELTDSWESRQRFRNYQEK